MCDNQNTEQQPLGAAVLVGGRIVAWFAEFTDEAQEWCTANYFGQWLVWRATPPNMVPLTKEEYERVQKEVEEFRELFKRDPHAD